jgi:MoxR-like ATPase
LDADALLGAPDRLVGSADPMSVPVITPSHLDDDYGLSAQIEAELVPPWTDTASFVATVASVRDTVAIEEEAVRVALVLLQHWHTMLVGPPGTGKTMLAERLAELWNAKLIRVTPSMDWTAFHAIGGKAPREGSLSAYDGVVTNAVLESCKTAIEYAAAGEGPQATWLLIDEINRCEADRVFSPLLTTLGSRRRPQILELSHHDDPLKRRLYLPPSFRIISTANLSDAQFVEQLSQAFIRRFQRLDLRVPARPSPDVITSLSPRGRPSRIGEPFVHEFSVVARQVRDIRSTAPDFELALVRLAQLVLLARYAMRWEGIRNAPEPVDPPFDTVAIGTAQVVDALLLTLDLVESPSGLTLEESADVAAARTIAPQLARAGPDGLRSMRIELENLAIFQRVRGELAQSVERFESGSYF